MTDTPVLRIRPNKGTRFAQGAPWLYADELVLDRRSKAIEPGTIVQLQNADRTPLAMGAANPASKIAFRVLDRDPDATIDAAWLDRRLGAAHALRERLYGAPFYRLVHAEADGLPGVVIDRFGDAAVIQPNAAWADQMLPQIIESLQRVTGVTTVVMNGAGRARKLEGLGEETRVICGQLAGPVDVPMNGAIYRADLTGGQKTGLYFDQRDNHAFAARLARGARTLDVFSHVGGFGLAMLAGGAQSALSVDGSAPALALAAEGAERMGAAARFETRKADAFEALTALAAEGAQFDVVICDPPAFAPAKPALEAGLRAYERVARLASALVAPQGVLGLCSCSHAADLTKFRDASLRGIHRAGRTGRILHTGGAGPDHPVHPALAETSYLKSIFLSLD